MDEIEIIKRQAKAWGISLEEPTLGSLVSYAQRLAEYREANVVGVQDFSRLLLEHVLDSLSCLLFEPLRRARNVVDVGAGGGLPGIPLKIARPGLGLTLVEATGKKVRFLERIVEELSLDGVEAVNARTETIGREPAYREKYDVATARALASLSVLAEYCLPLVKKNGFLVAMKALPDDKELEEGRMSADALGAEISELIKVEFIPEIPAKQRYLVVLRKVLETPDEYPRRPGVPKKSPLGRS